MFADLHLHTNYSDGGYSPAELALLGRQHGLAALAVTDHDTVEGCAALLAACQAQGLEGIAGTEFTAEVDGQEVHLLAYFINPENPVLLARMSQFQAVRQNRIHEIVARLNRLGIPLQAETVFKLANCRAPGRPHVGRALVQGGFCANLDETFDRFLGKRRPAWVPKYKISAGEAISLIHQAGGLAVMAHPGLSQINERVPGLVAAGLDGLECFHPKHRPATTKYYQRMADQFQLLITGGSDCHGSNKAKPLIGTIKVPYAYVQRMKTRLRPAPALVQA